MKTLLRTPDLIAAIEPIVGFPVSPNRVFELIGIGDVVPHGCVGRTPVFVPEQIGPIARLIGNEGPGGIAAEGGNQPVAVLYTDGAAFPNPGHAAGGYAVYSGDRLVCSGGVYLGHGTNNEAEYVGLIAGLEAARRLGFEHITIYSDSRLIVGQISGRMRCTKPHLAKLRDRANGLLRQFAKWHIGWKPRRENKVADELAKRAAQEQRDIEGGASYE
jgi:ribonuclease HI